MKRRAVSASYFSPTATPWVFGIYAKPFVPCKGDIFVFNCLCCPYRAQGQRVSYYVWRCHTLNYAGLSARSLYCFSCPQHWHQCEKHHYVMEVLFHSTSNFFLTKKIKRGIPSPETPLLIFSELHSVSSVNSQSFF